MTGAERKSSNPLRGESFLPRASLSAAVHDFEKLHGVHELSELHDLAAAHVIDMHDLEIQLLARVLPRTRVARDHRHRVARGDELPRRDGEVRDVLHDRDKDVLRHGLPALIDAAVW